MGAKRLLICGIDPGITTAYALIDVEGKLVASASGKGLDLSSIVAQTHSYGKIILVGTDKGKAPSLVQQYAAKMGARLVVPKEDLKVEEKRLAVDKVLKDAHEADALAAALYALWQFSSLFRKIDSFCQQEHKEHLKHDIIEKVLKEGMSIRDAACSLEPEREIMQEEEKAMPIITEKTLQRKQQAIDDLKQQLIILKRHAHVLKRDLEQRKQPTLIVQKAPSKELQQKDQLISHLRSSVSKKEQEKEKWHRSAQQLEHLLSKANTHYVLKKLKNLGSEEFKKKQFLHIQKDDILLVDDPNSMSMHVIDELRKQISLIVHTQPVSERVKGMLPFIFVDASLLQLKEVENYAIVPKKQLDEQRSARRALHKIIEEYKKERQFISS